MDGASIAIIEPKIAAPAQPAYQPQSQPQARTAPPILTPRSTPAVEPLRTAAQQPAYAPQAYAPQTYAPQPAREPIYERPAAHYEPEERALPLEAAAPIEPKIVAPRQPAYTAPITEQGHGEDEDPLFPQVHYSEDRERKGFFSLFGRGRQDEPPPLRDYRNDPTPVLEARAQAAQQAAAPVQTPPVQQASDAGEDLEIPSFLRRLAN
jgi:cell division protein FtsZ